MSGPAYFTSIYGNTTFEGMEWDLEYAVDRGLVWRDSIGGRPRAARIWASPYIHDAADLSFTLWTNAAQAQAIEERRQGGSGIYLTDWTFDLGLPGLSTSAPIPGFGNYAGGGIWLYKGLTLAENLESMGRKGPRLDLYGYRVNAHFSAIGNVAVGQPPANERGNTHPTGIQTVPAVLARKFMTHQIQSWSEPVKPLPTNAPAIVGAYNGARYDAAMSLDHLSSAETDEVVTWFRGQRDTAFSLTTDKPFGPANSDTVNVVARDMTVNRGAGWWWDIKLDLTKI